MPHAEAKMGEPVVNGEKHYSQFLDVSRPPPLQPNAKTQNKSQDQPILTKHSLF